MKVLYCTDFFLPVMGGIEVFSAKLIPALQQRGYQITVVTSSEGLSPVSQGRSYSIEDTISVHRFPFWEMLNSHDLKQTIALRQTMNRFVKEFKPDLIHLHFGATTYFHLPAIRTYPAATLTTIHSCLPASLSSASLLYQVLQSTHWVNTVSSTALADVRRLTPEVTARSSVIYCGIELPDAVAQPISFDSPSLLCLGRLVPKKGVDVAVNALALLVQQFPNLQLAIAGDGPEKTNLKQQVYDLGLDDRVDFLGWIEPDQVAALFNTATIALLPSRAEGLPLVALQAAQMARPIVATHVDGLPEIVVHQETGLLVKKENSVALAEAITFFLENPTLAIQMGQAAQQRVQTLFSFPHCVDQYDGLYQKLLSEHRQKTL